MRHRTSRRHRSSAWLTLALLACTPEPPEPTPAPRIFHVRALWLSGADEDRADMDRYFDCLLHRSNLPAWWDGEAVVRYAGSTIVTPPPEAVRITDAPTYLANLRARGELPPADDPNATTVDLIFGRGSHLDLDGCAQLTTFEHDGHTMGAAMVRVTPVCWPGTVPLRNLTQLALQELVEVVDWLLGYAPCAGDGACQGDGACPLGCDAFVGLTCEGAPTGTYTGCGSRVVDGWVVQRLSREGRDPRNCLRCTTCDFVPVSQAGP